MEIEKGQVWSYKCRENEEGSRLTILKIEELDGEEMVHIRVDGLKMRNKNGDQEPLTTIDHLPFSVDAFKASILQLKDKTQVSINEGYMEWRAMHVQNKAGIYAVGIAEVIDMIEITIQS